MTTESCHDFMKKKELEFIREKEKHIRMKSISREGYHYWVRDAWTFMPQTNYSEKVFIIERMRKMGKDDAVEQRGSAIDEIEYRIGYFVVGKNGNKKGRWTWGQYCPLIPANDFDALLEKGRTEGTIKESKHT